MLRIAAALLSGVLLALAFEPFGLAELAWLAMVPGLVAFRFATSTKGAAGLGFLCGLSCWLVSLYWFIGMSESQEAGLLLIWLGQFALSAWCAIFFIPIAVFTALWFRRVDDGRDKMKNVAYILLAAALWAGCEWLRSVLFTGFPWNTIGVTQYKNLAAIQIASLGGVYAVGFIVMALNLGFATTVQRYIVAARVRTERKLGWHPEIVLPMALLGAALSFGITQIKRERARSASYDTINIAMIQPNISQYEKWDEAFADTILKTLYGLTLEVCAKQKPDLVVWPETALPDHWKYEVLNLHALLRRIDTPILTGAIHYKPDELDDMEFRNGSFLFEPGRSDFVDDPDGAELPHYDKQHLVLFGEYVPFRETFPILGKLNPVPYFCLPGDESTIIETAGHPMSPLICFEDVMPYLSRRAVRGGARVLVNQTNDAWFDPYPEADQHMPHAVLRSVEHRVPMIRCTNTGRSCVIDTIGRLTHELPRLQRSWLFAEDVAVPGEEDAGTLYTRVGDVFAWACFGLGLLGFVWTARSRRRSQVV